MNNIAHWLKKLHFQFILVFIFLSFSSMEASAQFTVELRVLQGSVSTTCTDGIFGGPGEPTWGLAVENQNPKFYSNICPNLTSYPNQNTIHYSTTVNCLSDLNGGELFVCLWAFDNDLSNFADRCNFSTNESDKGCLEVLCGNFILPLPGTEATYTLDNSNFVLDPPDKVLSSTGSVTFKITVSEDATDRTIAPNDHICNAIALPIIPNNIVDAKYNNNCATSIDDPTPNFTTAHSVWFKFTPTESRNALVQVESDLAPPLGIDAIKPALAVYYAPTNNCNDNLVEFTNHLTNFDLNSFSLDLKCLNPKLTYYILVDGLPADPTGFFSVSVVEQGYPTPIQKDTSICRGQIIDVGNRSYANTGIYLDTIANEGCVEILETNLTVIEQITLDLKIGSLARGDGEGGGTAVANTQSGTGDYSYLWSNGQTNQAANNLIGGLEYCVTITDEIAGCAADTCFIMDFPIPITANVVDGLLNCSYDEFGQIQLTLTTGKPPYNYRLQGIDDPSIIKNGVVTKNDSTFLIEEVPVGTYNVFVDNSEGGQRFEAKISNPPPIDIALLEQINPDCAGNCSGRISVDATGGTGNFNYNWKDESINSSTIRDLCAGDYQIIVIDDNNCQDTTTYTLADPDAPTISFTNVLPVACFGDSNGQATIVSSESLSNILWDNGETTETATRLDANTHKVTFINEKGCESSDSISISQPTNPLIANIEIMETIDCGGESNGVLADVTSGGNGNYEYIWSTGATTDFIENLPSGMYNLTVRDDNGCIDDTTVALNEPLPINATISVQDVSCLGGENSGIISVTNPVGGTAPYRFSVNNQNFNGDMINLVAGTYSVVMQDDKGCEKTFTPLTLSNPPEVTVNLGADMNITLGQTIELKATANSIVTYEWLTTDSLNCLDCATVSARPFNNAKYSVLVTDENTGCTATDEILVTVLKARKIFVPNVFSPNGDGINDLLNIFGGQEVAKVLRFEIYSREGALVYKKENFNLGNGIGWDGEYQGQKLSTNVFIYFAEIEFVDKETAVFRGDFTLVVR